MRRTSARGKLAKSSESMNEINVIRPYKHYDMWVFDDPAVGLAREPFVAGADTMIDRVVAGIPDAAQGFVMVFSGKPFPGHRFKLDWIRFDGTGNWYRSEELQMEGRLCPALLRYFDQAPKQIYVQVKARSAS